MKKRILVIGGTGLLGEPVARSLQQAGYEVRLLVRDKQKAAERFGTEFDIVQGNIFNRESLLQSLDDCFGVHINLSGEREQEGVETIASAAAEKKVQRITYISGTSVSEENTWVPLIRQKFYAEKAIRERGVAYSIFCPTWFMEVLPKFVRGNMAVVFGKQPNPYHLIAVDDYAGMVTSSYSNNEAANKRLIIHGPEDILFHDAVKRYCEVFHPHIKEVKTMPHWLVTIIATLKGAKEMKEASSFMNAFAKTGELGDPSEANRILGAPEITLNDWLQRKR